MRTNAYMGSYWRGYRAARAMYEESGIGAVRYEYDFGLNGASPAYCAGWLRFIRMHSN